MTDLGDRCLLTQKDLSTEHGLRAFEIHERLVLLSRAHRRVESGLCFYLLEVDTRQLYEEYGHASTVDYARECLGFDDWKTRTFLRLARRLEELPKMKDAFRRGEIPYTKAREVTKVATSETEEEWIQKCNTLSNRQLETAIQEKLPPKKSRTLVLVLNEERMETWERTREAMEKLAGKTLTELEAFDLACAESLCTHDLTPSLGDPDAPMHGYVAEVIERDGFRCTRPGCGNRSALTGNHIQSRARGGPDDAWNLHTVCAVCHNAITRGVLKVSGRAPDELTWEGPFGNIESPQSSREPSSTPPAAAAGDPVSNPEFHELNGDDAVLDTVHEAPRTEPSLARESQTRYGTRPMYHVVHGLSVPRVPN